MKLWSALVLLLSYCCGTLSSGEDASSVKRTLQEPKERTPCSQDPLRYCAPTATCTADGQCECPDQQTGDPEFACYKAGVKPIEIVDNLLRAPKQDPIRLLLPCQHNVASFTSKGSDYVDSCDTKIYTQHEIIGGRTVNTGVEVHIALVLHNYTTHTIAFRITGSLENGKYEFTESSRTPRLYDFVSKRPKVRYTIDDEDNDFGGSGSGDGEEPSFRLVDDDDDTPDVVTWGQPKSLELPNGAKIHSFVDSDNFVVVHAPSCGVEVRMRPSPSNSAEGGVKPGLSIAIDHYDHEPIKFDNDGELVEGMRTFSLLYKKSAKLKLFILTLSYPAPQSGPGSGQCLKVINNLKKYCTQHATNYASLKVCKKYLNADFVECFESNKTDEDSARPTAMELFNDCVLFGCWASVSTCNSFYLAKNRAITKCPKELPHDQPDYKHEKNCLKFKDNSD